MRPNARKTDAGKCLHVNRVCTETRPADPFIKRRKYNCNDCKKTFHTAEIELDIERWSTEAAIVSVAKWLPDIRRHTAVLSRAIEQLQKALNP